MKWKEIWTYYKEHLRDKVRRGLKIAAQAFINALWNYIKEEVILSARKSLKLIAALLCSPEIKAKKEAIIDLILLKVKLPVWMKPLKFMVRRVISDKIDEIIRGLLGKGFELMG